MKNPSPPEPNWRPRFFTIWGGQALSLLGSQIVQFALIWYLTETTGSATVLAMSTLVAFLPAVFLGPFVGALVDRWNRRAVMFFADSAIALATLVLALLFALGQANVVTVMVLLFVRAVAEGFHEPAMTASTSLMVPDEHLTRVAGINQVMQGGLAIVSAPLGALLIQLMTVQSVLMIDVGTALFAIVPLLFISVPQPERKTGAEAQSNSYWSDFRAGLRYLLGWRSLLLLSMLVTVVNLVMAPVGALFPILVTDHFGGGAAELGWLQSAFGVGLIGGGLLLGIWGGFERRIYTSLAGLAGLGLVYVGLGFVPSSGIWLAIGLSIVGGLLIPLVNGPVQAILQATVDPEMQGRVFTLIRSVGRGMIPLGLLIAGPFADTYGVTRWYILAGAICVVMALIGFATPAVTHIEERRNSHVEESAPEPSSS